MFWRKKRILSLLSGYPTKMAVKKDQEAPTITENCSFLCVIMLIVVAVCAASMKIRAAWSFRRTCVTRILSFLNQHHQGRLFARLKAAPYIFLNSWWWLKGEQLAKMHLMAIENVPLASSHPSAWKSRFAHGFPFMYLYYWYNELARAHQGVTKGSIITQQLGGTM